MGNITFHTIDVFLRHNRMDEEATVLTNVTAPPPIIILY